MLQLGTLDIEAEWQVARRNRHIRGVTEVLRRMAGRRERCMYCQDSQGSDTEHFWPKQRYPLRAFTWDNLLLCCTHCGRLKGNRFPLNGEHPLLVDPSSENPWLHLDFDPDTGNLTARFDVGTNSYSRKGEVTVELFRLDQREAVANGYRKTWRRLTNLVRVTLQSEDGVSPDLAQRLWDEDDHGLLGWCVDGPGQFLTPFTELRARHPDIWDQCVHYYQNSGDST